MTYTVELFLLRFLDKFIFVMGGKSYTQANKPTTFIEHFGA